MIKIEHSIVIQRPLQEVFDFVSNPTNDAKWVGPVKNAWLASEGPMEVGARVSSVAEFMGRKIENTSEVTAWDPPNQVSMKSAGGPVPFEQTVALSEEEGGTKLTLVSHADVGGFFKLAEGLVGRQLQKQVESDFETLKKLLETGE